MRRRKFLQYLSLPAFLPGAMLPLPSRAEGDNDAGDNLNLLDNPDVLAFIENMTKTQGFAHDELRTFFSHLVINEQVLRLNGVSDEPDKPPKKVYWREYRKARLTPQNIGNGVRFARRHAAVLRRAEQQYGVPPAIATAIIGVETRYGTYTGNFLVAEALATLAFAHPTRRVEFRAELVEFLIYLRQEKLNPGDLYGSYAGAFGIPQFLPSSTRKFAVDFDGDGVVNLFKAGDAIGSIGNFLKKHGWQAARGVTYPATADADIQALIEETARHKYKPVFTRAELNTRGVSSPAPDKGRYVFIDLENRYDDEYRLGTENFYALTRYNRSFKYACIVADLADKIRQRV